MMERHSFEKTQEEGLAMKELAKKKATKAEREKTEKEDYDLVEKLVAEENFAEIENKEVIDGYFEVLLSRSKKINEGNNGVINLVNIADFPRDLIDFFQDKGIDLKHDKAAIKMLKIYDLSRGESEAEGQRKAYELVENYKNIECPSAKVPRLLDFRSLKLKSGFLKEKMKEWGINVSREGNCNVNVLIIDFIDGKDLATILFEEVIKRHPRLEKVRETINLMSLDEKATHVSGVLGYEIPGRKHFRAGDLAREDTKIQGENALKLVNFLRRSGYVLPKEWLSKIQVFVDLLKKNGFAHADLHERNVMIDKRGEVFIIDFGEFCSREELDKRGRGRRPDDGIITRYSELTKTLKEAIEKERDSFIDGLLKLERSLSKKSVWVNFLEEIRKEEDLLKINKKISALANSFGFSFGDFSDDFFCLVVIKLAEKNFENAISLVDYDISFKGSSFARRNKLKKIITYLKNRYKK